MEFETNYVNIIVHRPDDSPESAQKVNDIFIKLEKLRLRHLNPVETVRFICYTPYAEGIETELLNIEIRPYSDLGIDLGNNPENFRKLDLIADDQYTDEKMCIIDINTVPQELSQETIFRSVPMKGEVNDDHYGVSSLSQEVKDKIKEEKLVYARISTDWTQGNKPTDDVIMCYGNAGFSVYKHYIAEGNPNNLTLGEYIQTHFKGVVLNMVPGVFSTYYAHDEEKNKSNNDLWETEVKEKYFPKYFEGYGGDENDNFIYYGHEYKTINNQCKWIKIDETAGSRSSDLYARLWIL